MSLSLPDHEKEKDAADTEVNVTQIEMEGQFLPQEISPEEDARIRKKIDMHLLPLFCTIYGLQLMDKTCMAYGSVMGFLAEDKLTLAEYSWLGSMFYFGYLVGEYPLGLALQKLPLAKVTSFNIIAWGAMLCLMSVGKNFAGLMAIRFFLGFFESSITPALTLFTSQYYKRSEQGTRTGIWFSFNFSGGIIGSSLAYGLYEGTVAKTLPISGWKLVFIILGSVTAAFGFVFAIFVPDTPSKARFFNARERVLAVERIRANQQGVVNHTFRVEQVKEAFIDPLTWLYVAVSLLVSIPNGGITNFSSILVKGMGFTTAQTLLLGMATASIAILMISFLWLGDRLKHRCLVTIIPTLISIIGTTLLWALPSSKQNVRLLGYYLTLAFIITFVTTLSLITSNVAGQTKKTTVNAMFLVAYCVGNIIGPQTFRAADAPRYTPALATCVATNAAIVFVMLAIHFLYKRANARKDASTTKAELDTMIGHEFDDLTDRTNPAFRYTL